jgi:hypothetical protein
MVPPQIRFIPIYIMLAKVSLLNTYWAIILPYATSVLGTFLIHEAFNSINDDVLDAARIEGANVLQIIFRIMVPIAMPTIIAFSLFSVVCHWNDYFWPLVVTTNETVRTLPLGVALLRERGTGSRWHIILAGNMFGVVPMVVTFRPDQRHIIRAFTFTSPKCASSLPRPVRRTLIPDASSGHAPSLPTIPLGGTRVVRCASGASWPFHREALTGQRGMPRMRRRRGDRTTFHTPCGPE